MEDALILEKEDELGVGLNVRFNRLKELCKVGAKDTVNNVQLLFVSACHSKNTGEAFVESGVPHVIAVKTTTAIADIAASKFSKMFYRMLLDGNTVRYSFEEAKSFLYTHEKAGMQEESEKFLLLPAYDPKKHIADPHMVSIFSPGVRAAGEFNDLTTRAVCDIRPSIIEARNLVWCDIVQKIVGNARQQDMVIYVSGDQGMGKSEILKNCGKYVADRNLVQGVFFIDVKEKLECEPDHQLFQMIEEEFRVSGVVGDGSSNWEYCERPDQLLHLLKQAHEQQSMSGNEKDFLLILDHLFDYEDPRRPNFKRNWKETVERFIKKSLGYCRFVKILAASREPWRFRHGKGFCHVQVPSMNPEDAVTLLQFLAPPRQLDNPNRKFEENGVFADMDVDQIQKSKLMVWLDRECKNNPGVIDDICHHWQTHLTNGTGGFLHLNQLNPPVHFQDVIANYPSIVPVKPIDTNVFENVADFRKFLDNRQQKEDAWHQVCKICRANPETELDTRNFAQALAHVLQNFIGPFIEQHDYRRRPLTPAEIRQICSRRGLSRDISRSIGKKTFLKVFWPDFSKIIVLIYLIRHQYFMVNPLRVLGFVSKESVSKILGTVLKSRNQLFGGNPSGAFQLRFSTNYPGSLNLVYLDSKLQQKTILIGVSASRNCFKINVGGAEKDVKNLPHLFSWLKLKHLMVIDRLNSQAVDAGPIDSREMHRMSTEEAFGVHEHR